MSLYSRVESGDYRMVHNDGHEALWWNPNTRSKVCESYVHDNDPFNLLLTDFDGFWVDTERRGAFFDYVWGKTLQEAGLEGSIEELTTLRWKGYEWESDVKTSTIAWMNRIKVARDKIGKPYNSHDAYQLSLLLSQQARDKFRAALGDQFQNIDDPGILLAERKEQLGAQLLCQEPRLVLVLASLKPGALEFLESIPDDVTLAIVSAGRRATILEPIMEAYSLVLPSFARRFKGMLFGEEDGGGHTKPSEGFITSVRWNLAHRLHDAGKIPLRGISIHNTLMLGDRALDTPVKRGGMHHITVGQNPGHLGPLTSHASDLYHLLEKIRNPKITARDFTLRKLHNTLNC